MILLIAIVIGAIVGGAASGEGGALAGALFGWLILRSQRQQREIEALRGQSLGRVAAEVPLSSDSAPTAAAAVAPASSPLAAPPSLASETNGLTPALVTAPLPPA